VLLYDGDCGFCRAWVDYWKELTGNGVDYTAMQHAPTELESVIDQHGRSAVLLVDRDGCVKGGAHAVFTALADVPGRRWLLSGYRRVPGFAGVSEACYVLIARHRNAAFRVTKVFWGLPPRPASHAVTAELFLRLLGLIYLIAFLSFGVQATGLIGRDGLAPIAEALPAVRHYYGVRGYWLFPTLFWFNASDAAIAAIWLAGALIAVLLILGVRVRIACALLLVLYLSLVTAGYVFLSFQWDALLLETGLVALLLGRSGTAVWLGRWLLFRLMFMSGAVKLLSGDATWRDLTALRYHFETQPLPTVFGWYAHQLPGTVLRVFTAAMFVVELGVPFLIFLPRRARFVAAIATASFQVGIFLTGNYAFFNLLTLLLCLLLLDDARLERWLPRQVLAVLRHHTPAAPTWVPHASESEAAALRAPRRALGFARRAVIGIVVLASLAHLSVRLFEVQPPVLSAVAQAIEPLRVVNGYGLFAVMTTSRPEIVLEGSDDGIAWREYHFRWKPGALDVAPRWVQPHQPRLDWQMWFAALGDYSGNPWTLRLLVRLLQGSPAVIALLDGNPFPGAPPHYLRAVLYRYHFTTLAERRQTGNWWRRERLGLYLPALSLADLMRAGVR
jgi:lipase maturation factor 1